MNSISQRKHPASQPSQIKLKRRRRELVPVRRLKRIRRAVSKLRDLRSEFFDLAIQFEVSIESLETAGARGRDTDAGLVIFAIENEGAWTIVDISEWTMLSRSAVYRILRDDLIPQGVVKKFRSRPCGNGRPAYIYRLAQR